MPNNKGKRSANGAGTIRHRADGSWQGIITIGIDPATGKPKKKSVYGKTQKEVRQKMTDLRQKLDNDAYINDTNMSIEAWANVWLSEFCVNVRPYTIRNYKAFVNRILIPRYGKMKLKQLKPIHVQKLWNDLLAEGKAKSSINTYARTLHRCIEQAVDLQYIAKNPCDKAISPSLPKSNIKPIPSDKINEFICAADETPYGDAMFVAMFTGLRCGELLGLPWNNIDFDTGQILISQQAYYVNHTISIVPTTKSGRNRVIVPPQSVMDRLAKLRDIQCVKESDKDIVYHNQYNLVFTNLVGEPLHRSNLYTAFKKVVTQIGLPDTRLHDLRHTYATLSLELGDNLKTVSTALGHSTIAITGNVYAHVTDKMRKDSADRLQNLINKVQNKDQ